MITNLTKHTGSIAGATKSAASSAHGNEKSGQTWTYGEYGFTYGMDKDSAGSQVDYGQAGSINITNQTKH